MDHEAINDKLEELAERIKRPRSTDNSPFSRKRKSVSRCGAHDKSVIITANTSINVGQAKNNMSYCSTRARFFTQRGSLENTKQPMQAKKPKSSRPGTSINSYKTTQPKMQKENENEIMINKDNFKIAEKSGKSENILFEKMTEQELIIQKQKEEIARLKLIVEQVKSENLELKIRLMNVNSRSTDRSFHNI